MKVFQTFLTGSNPVTRFCVFQCVMLTRITVVIEHGCKPHDTLTVTVAQLVVREIVILLVAGSSPVRHPCPIV